MEPDLKNISEEKLISLPEPKLRKEIIIPLLNKIGCRNVTDKCGPEEWGVDVYFEIEDIFGRTKYFGISAKKGNLNKSSKNIPSSIITIHTQIKQAFRKTFAPSNLKTEVHLDGYYIIASGRVNRLAKEYILTMRQEFPYIDIIEGPELIQIISRSDFLRQRNAGWMDKFSKLEMEKDMIR